MIFRQLFFVLAFSFLAAPALAAEPAKESPAAKTGDLQRLIDTLEDDAKREAFVQDLQALIAAQKKTEEEAEQPVGSRFLKTLSDTVEQGGRKLSAAAAALIDVRTMFAWVRDAITDPATRSLWLWVLVKIVAILAAGLAAEWIVQRVLRQTRASIETRETDGFFLNLVFAATRTLLDLIALAAFAAAAYGVMTVTAPAYQGQVIALALINASVIARAVAAVARLVLAPKVAAMRLFPIGDETANYSFVWIRRLTNLVAYGYFLIEATPALGLPLAAYGVLLKLLGLIVGLLLIMLVLQNRHHVAERIRGDQGGAFGAFRQRLADVWHMLLIIYLVVVYGVWAIEVQGGFEFVLRATVLSIVIVVAARGLVELLLRAVHRGFSLSDDQRVRFPGLEARANRYLPFLLVAIKTVIYAAAILALLDVWGIAIVAWFAGPVGKAVLARMVTIFLIIVGALVIWEIISAFIEQYLTSTDREGNAVARSQRALTLLPLIRNVILVVLVVMVGLTILSELGINIGPLIAGAGIVGLAIGFGAQTIVKDFITGFFILIEDTVAVGDSVELGGHAGRVEAMSIRSIQLRDVSGQVHRVPFSEVSTTINKSKGFSFAVFDIGVGYSEDIDRCIDVIRDVGDSMKADPEYAATIIDDIQIMGVQSLGDSAVVIRARFRTTPGKQFGIRRAFNRLIKNRFDAEGIEIPFPHRTIYFGEDSHGKAPPARIRMEPTAEGSGPAESPTPDNARSRRPEGEAHDAIDDAGGADGDDSSGNG